MKPHGINRLGFREWAFYAADVIAAKVIDII